MKKQLFTALATVSLASSLLAGHAAAAGSSSFSLSPATGSFAQNNTFTVSVFENGTDVNVVTAKLTYDASKLTCLSAGGSSAFANTITASCSNGNVTISRYTGSDANGNPTTVSGTQQVGSITFKAVAAGTANVNFAAGSQIASNGANTWDGNTAGGAYAVTAAPAATAAPVATATPKTSTGTAAKTATPAPTTGVVAGQATSSATPSASATPGASTSPEASATPQADVKTAASHSNKNWLWLLIIPVIAAAALAVRKFRSAQ